MTRGLPSWQYQLVPVYWIWLCLPLDTRDSIIALAQRELKKKGLNIEGLAHRHWHEFTPLERAALHRVMLEMASTRHDMIEETMPKANSVGPA